MNEIHVSATCDREFVKLLQAYKTLKANKQTLLLALCLVIMLPFTYALRFLAVFLLITLVAAVMTYLVVSQQNTIDEIQRSLYSICLKSISEQVDQADRRPDLDTHQD